MRPALISMLTLCLVMQAGHATHAQTPANDSKKTALTDNEQKINKLEAEQQRLLEEIKKPARLSNPEQQKKLDRAAAEIERQIEAQSRPLRILPSTKFSSPVAKAYIQTMSKKIEDCGTEHFPMQNKKKLYGEGFFMFRFNRAGELKSSHMLVSSKNKALDMHFLKIIAASAPFGPVPAELHEGIYKDFEVFSKFNFSHQNKPDKQDMQDTEIKYHCRWKN